MKSYYSVMALCKLDGQTHYIKVTLNGVKALEITRTHGLWTAIGEKSGTVQAAIMESVGAMVISSDA